MMAQFPKPFVNVLIETKYQKSMAIHQVELNVDLVELISVV